MWIGWYLLKKEFTQFEAKCLWLTGLPGAGKSTIAASIKKKLLSSKCPTYILDGDNIRNGINNDLSFSLSDRTENTRRIAEIAKLFIDAKIMILVASICPLENQRKLAKKIIGKDKYIEIYISTPLEVCMQRDPKQHYKMANNGAISDFTGINSPYEPNTNPDLVMNTTNKSVEDCTETIFSDIICS